TEMMEMFDAADNPKMQTRLGHVLSASYRAKELVNQILTFSRRSGQEKHPVLLAPLIRETAKFIQVLLPSGIRLEVRMSEDHRDITVMSNPVEIHQLVMNLCTNSLHAIEAKTSEGKITVTLSRLLMDPHDAALHLGLGPGNYARLTVEDTGKGMSRETMERMFDPFFTTKPQGEGTGMGLSMVHGIVQSASGRITAESREEEGTCFHILLPEVCPDEPEISTDLPEPGRPKGGGRILLVDDEAELLAINGEMLEKLGYQVRTETSAQAALAWFRKHFEEIDLIITDLSMPELQGDYLAWRVKHIRPNIPVILCSGRIDSERAQSVLIRFGIDGFLNKPAGIGELAQTVRAYLAPSGNVSKETDHG
ncbi:MAG: ATP-binding protein, partial [Desulfobacterales bacterium]|nr:ATP-binding protein [Desulfobacterales bacterium]